MSSGIVVREVKTKKEIRLFAKFPVDLYKDCPYYVPSLRSDDIDLYNPKKNYNLQNNLLKAFCALKTGFW